MALFIPSSTSSPPSVFFYCLFSEKSIILDQLIRMFATPFYRRGFCRISPLPGSIDSTMQKSTFLLCCVVFVFLFASHPARGATETVQIPIALDYSFLRAVMINQLYTEPGERALIVDQETGDDCVSIELWNPEVTPAPPFIKTGSNIKIRAGVRLWGRCFQLITWEGYLESFQRVYLDQKSGRIHLETVDSHI